MTGLPPPARAADFQAAWYYSLVLSAILALGAGAVVVVARLVMPMWRQGQRGIALAVAASTGVAALLLLSMLATVVGGLLPGALRGGG